MAFMKNILAIIVVLLAIAAGVFLWYKGGNMGAVSSMGTGSIVEIGENTVKIKGYVEREGGEIELITVNFSVKSNTKYSKNTLVIPQNQNGGEPFTPEIVQSEGAFSDLAVGMPIGGVQARGKLVDGGEAKALEIDYSVMEVRMESGDSATVQ